MVLYPDHPPTTEVIQKPWMEVACWKDEPFVMLFTGGASFFEEGAAPVRLTVEGRQHGPYSVTTAAGRSMSLAAADAAEVVDVLAMAGEAGQDVDVELHSYGDRDRYSYAVAGFNHNYHRLPCSGQ